jgi:hypothetical protein
LSRGNRGREALFGLLAIFLGPLLSSFSSDPSGFVNFGKFAYCFIKLREAQSAIPALFVRVQFRFRGILAMAQKTPNHGLAGPRFFGGIAVAEFGRLRPFLAWGFDSYVAAQRRRDLKSGSPSGKNIQMVDTLG